MIRVKLLEVRDRGTFIPVMAIGFNGSDHQLFREAGFGVSQPVIMLTKLESGGGFTDPYHWPANPRTMREAHIAICQQWGELKDGDVIDVEYELGESSTKKISQLV